jgi:hypothetical protein
MGMAMSNTNAKIEIGFAKLTVESRYLFFYIVPEEDTTFSCGTNSPSPNSLSPPN